MDEGKQVGKNKIDLNPKIIRDRIRRTLMEVRGVKEKTAIDWSNRIYQRAQNFLRRRRDYAIRSSLYEQIAKAHRGKSKEEIDAYFEIVYRQAMKPSKAKPLPKPEYSPEVAAVYAARKAERKRLVSQNAHLRRGDHIPKEVGFETVF